MTLFRVTKFTPFFWCFAVFAAYFGTYSATASSIIEFNMVVPESAGRCTINVLRNGRLTPNVQSTILSSKNPGARPARARVRSIRPRNSNSPPFNLRFLPPSRFSSGPLGANTDVVFSTLFSGRTAGRRGRNWQERNGTVAIRLLEGGNSASIVTAHLIATKTTGIFTAGRYVANPVLLCE